MLNYSALIVETPLNILFDGTFVIMPNGTYRKLNIEKCKNSLKLVYLYIDLDKTDNKYYVMGAYHYDDTNKLIYSLYNNANIHIKLFKIDIKNSRLYKI